MTFWRDFCLGSLLVAYGWMWGFNSHAAEFKIVTASERGTYIVVGRDICQYIAPDAGFDCESVPSAGSTENVFALRFKPGIKFAIVQSDTFQSFLDEAGSGNKEAANLIGPLRVILPLYNEEIYFLVREDSPLHYVHEIKDARIAAGAYGSGTALTSVTLYRRMFGVPLPKPQYLSNEDALRALTDKQPTVDVAVVVGGQPMSLITGLKPEAKMRLLEFDPLYPASKEVLKTYFSATIKASNYPNLLQQDLPGVAVKAYLVTYDYNLKQTQGVMTKFARSLCQHFPELQANGHAKWKEVQLALPELGAGWSYYPPIARELQKCIKPTPRSLTQQPASCPQQDYVLGLCK